MKRLDNKGMTLVELILAAVILAMSGLMLATTFSSAMRILNRATTYKNVSASAAETVEVAEKQDTINGQTFTVNTQEKNGTLTISYGGSATGSFEMSGQYYTANASKGDEKAALTYKEFLPSNFSYELPASPVGD